MAQFGPEQFWYPDETLAANVPAFVFERDSPNLALIYSDAGLTLPQGNPIDTDGSGFLSFYAAAGDYWIHIGGLTFDYTINDGVTQGWQAEYRHVQSVALMTWTIFHDLGTRPDVSVLDFAGSEVVHADIGYPDANTVTVDFNSPQTGIAYLRR